MEGNALTSVEEGIGRLSSLQTLYLSRNRLKELPETFCRLTSLRELHLKVLFYFYFSCIHLFEFFSLEILYYFPSILTPSNKTKIFFNDNRETVSLACQTNLINLLLFVILIFPQIISSFVFFFSLFFLFLFLLPPPFLTSFPPQQRIPSPQPPC